MYESIPEELKQCRNWVVWKYVRRGGKKTKIPVDPTTERNAKSNGPETWADFSTACEAAATGVYQGIGFMLSHSPYVGIDMDHCITTGPDGAPVFSETARRVLAAAKSYAEISPSGTGVHILIRGDIPDGKGRRNKEIEVYPAGRFFTMTGRTLQGCGTIRAAQDVLDAITQTIESERRLPKIAGTALNSTETERRDKVPAKDDEKLIEKIRRSRSGAKFAALYDAGDISAYGGDDSAADMALMNILAWWTGNDAARMERIFSASALARRDKWKRADYRQRTITRAIADTSTHYAGSMEPQTVAPDVLTRKPWTDRGMAERMMKLYGHILQYCMETRRWYRYNGTKWEGIADFNVDYNVYCTLTETRKALEEDWKQKDAESMPDNDEEKSRARIRRYLISRENNNATTNIIKAARDMATIHIGAFDADPWLLNCPNGVVNLKTFQLMPHDPAQLMMKCTGAAPIPGARSELWEKTVAEIMPDEETRKWMQKFAGYCLTGSTREEKFLFLFGPGGSGKSTFLEVIARAMGDYADTFPVEMLLTRRNDAGSGNEATPQLAKLAGVRLAVTSEAPPGRRFNDARMKLWTGGDVLTARALYGTPFTYRPQFKLVGSTNDMPSMIDAADEGMRRRLIIVPFEARPVTDVKLKETLTTADNLAAVLTWCIEGCQRWQREGLDPIPNAVKRRLFMYYTEYDDVGEFIDTCCKKDPNGREDSIALYDHFRMIYGNSMTKNLFTRTLTRRGFPQGKSNGRRVIKGLVYIGNSYSV